MIDTGGMTAAQLRRRLADEMLPTRTPGQLAVTFESFGFKYGTVRDPDLLFDVRFLPNPHYEPEMRPLTGLDPQVPGVRQHRWRARRVLRAPQPDARLPAAAVPGRRQVTPGGGGRLYRRQAPFGNDHREPGERFKDAPEYVIEVIHRDIDRAG